MGIGRVWLNDPYWLRAAKFVLDLQGGVPFLLAPPELNHLRSGCVPLSFSYILEPEDCVVLLPKDDVDQLPISWLDKRHLWKCLYADEVFVAFSFAAEDTAGPDQSEHLPYLYERAKKVANGQAVRKSRIDPLISDPMEGRPYVVVAAASLTGNAGDRLIATAARRLLQKAWPDKAIVVADGSPDRRLVACASAVVLGPGGMLYDAADGRFDLFNLANWFHYGFLAAEYGIPLFSLGLGHQGMTSEIGWKFVEELLFGPFLDH